MRIMHPAGTFPEPRALKVDIWANRPGARPNSQVEIATVMRVQGIDCRAKQAESLEQARHTADQDLRDLYTTIAKQWQRLAEQSETRPAFATNVSYQNPGQTDEPEPAPVRQHTVDPVAQLATEGCVPHAEEKIVRDDPAHDPAPALEYCTEQIVTNDASAVEQAGFTPAQNSKHLVSRAELPSEEVAATAPQSLNNQVIAGADRRDADPIGPGKESEAYMRNSDPPRGEEGEPDSKAAESCSSPEIEFRVASGGSSRSASENTTELCAEGAPARTKIAGCSELIDPRAEQISRIDQEDEFARTDAEISASLAISTGETRAHVTDSGRHPGKDCEPSDALESWTSSAELEISLPPNHSDSKLSDNAEDPCAQRVSTVTQIVGGSRINETRTEQIPRIDLSELAPGDAEGVNKHQLLASDLNSAQNTTSPLVIENLTLQIIDKVGPDQKGDSDDTPYHERADGTKSYPLERVFSLWFGPWRR
jgi:hypothetical protein